MRKMLNLVAVAALCVSGLVGCGGTIEPESADSLASTEQELKACLDNGTMAGACSSTESCVDGTCRPRCSSSGTCGSGQKCCPGHMYSDGSFMYPYCISTTSTCYTP
jgi:hypothetical protein